MKCTVECSVGEVVDKITILEIKLQKSVTESSFNNINHELKLLKSHFDVKQTSLSKKLQELNSKLWILEDSIRIKSQKKEFDSKYIGLAEEIHKTNDLRYQVKKEINEEYSSQIKEEKIYQLNNVDQFILLQNGQNAYNSGNFSFAKHIITKLMKKYIKTNLIYNDFTVNLLSSYDNVNNFYMEESYNQYFEDLLSKISNITISEDLREFTKKHLLFHFLRRKQYKKVYSFFNELNSITGPNVTKHTMSYSKNNTVLLYDGGGIGDKIMFFRLVLNLPQNQNFIFFLNDELVWIFQQICPSNVQLFGYNEAVKMPYFSSHCSLFYLMKVLEITETNIPFQPYLQSLQGTSYPLTTLSYSRRYIFNWKGNCENVQEKHNRSFALEEADNLFQEPYQFIVVNKCISYEERIFLKKYSNVLILDDIDDGKSFEHTIDILKQVNGMISTDTSLIHLALTMGIPSYVLLTKGAEWRWSNAEKWYPEANCFQQEMQGEWKDVLDNLKSCLRRNSI